MQRVVRTFVAVEVSPEVRGSAMRLIERLKQTQARIRWVESQNLHLTLKFLGDVESVEIPRVISHVQQAIADLESFDLRFRGAGAFPTAANPRTIWLGVADGAKAMSHLHEQVEKELAKLGFRSENRRFRPHITLGRVRDTRHGKRDLEELLEKHADFEGGISHVEEVVVFSSELKEDGPVYEPMGRAELRFVR